MLLMFAELVLLMSSSSRLYLVYHKVRTSAQFCFHFTLIRLYRATNINNIFISNFDTGLQCKTINLHLSNDLVVNVTETRSCLKHDGNIFRVSLRTT